MILSFERVNAAVIKRKVNEKVLLRERKRHTARRVASTRCAVLSNPDLVRGGDPVPVPGGGHTLGTPLPRPGMKYPSSYPDLGWGTPLPRPEMGYPPTQT